MKKRPEMDIELIKEMPLKEQIVLTTKDLSKNDMDYMDYLEAAGAFYQEVV